MNAKTIKPITRHNIQKWTQDFQNGYFGDFEQFHITGKKEDISTSALDDLTETAANIVAPNPLGNASEVVSSSSEDSGYGTGVFTISGNVSDGDTVTIGDHVYTFQTVLVDAPNNVLIGADATGSCTNLIAAINAGAGAGSAYGTGTVINAYVTAASGGVGIMDVVDKVGLLESATTETSATASWSAASLIQFTGIKAVAITYLDAVGKQLEEIVVMNGTTAVSLAAGIDFNYVQWMHGHALGSNGVAVGNIDLRKIAGSTPIYEKIVLGGNQSLSCRYTIPADSIGIVDSWHATGVLKTLDLRLRATCDRSTRQLLAGIFLFQDTLLLEASSGDNQFKPPLFFPPLCQIKVSGQSDAATGDAAAAFHVMIRKV
jgi:hypothetical protein